MTELQKPVVAGQQEVEGASVDMPDIEKDRCNHAFVLEKNILHNKSIFRTSEVLTCVIYCKLCGRLGGSSRIKS